MALTPALLGFPDRVGTTGWIAIGMLVLASVAGGASMYGYFLRPPGPLHAARARSGGRSPDWGFVFNHEPAMLALFFGLMAIGVGKPMIDNHRERRAGGERLTRAASWTGKRGPMNNRAGFTTGEGTEDAKWSEPVEHSARGCMVSTWADRWTWTPSPRSAMR